MKLRTSRALNFLACNLLLLALYLNFFYKDSNLPVINFSQISSVSIQQHTQLVKQQTTAQTQNRIAIK